MGNKKNILLISYYFPPMGMGGAGRPYALFRYLPENGYRVHVVSVKKVLFPHYDYSLLYEQDEGYICRTGSLDPLRILHKAGFKASPQKSGRDPGLVSLINYPDSKKGWNYFAFKQARRIINLKEISAIITTSPPPSTHVVGLKLKKMFNIPWVADFRDFWFSLPIEMSYKRKFQKRYALRLKDLIVSSADQIVSVNSSIKKYLGRGEVITNGADLEFEQFWQNQLPPENNKFKIGVLGTINQLCPIEPLFKAVAKLIDNKPEVADLISVVHVGHCSKDEMKSLINKYSLEKTVDLKDYLSKQEAFGALSDTDLLYLSVAEFEDYHILPGRLFDYLISNKPILGVVPDGSDAMSLITDYKMGGAFLHNDIEHIAGFLENLIMQKNDGKQIESLKPDEKYKYSTKHLAEKYALLLDRL